MNMELIEKNNALLKHLSGDNKKYCEKLLGYIRTARFFHDEDEVESLVAQIIQDIILAQENGESAEDYFGERPQDAADELIKNLGKASLKNSFKKVGSLFGASLIILLLTMLSSPEEGVNILTFILFALLCYLMVSSLFFFFHKGIYKKAWDKPFVGFIFGGLFAVPILKLGYVIFYLIPPLTPFFTLYPSNPVGIFLLILLIISGTFLAIHKKESRNIRLPFLPMIWILGGLGIALRIPQAEIWIDNHEMIIIVLLISGFIIFYIFSLVALLKIMKRQKRLRGDQ